MGVSKGGFLMFVDFDAIFKNKSQTESKVPECLLQYISRELPEGTKYEVDVEGNCYVSTDEQTLTLGGFVFKPSTEEKEILGENYTTEDLMAYSYNAQKRLEFELKKEGIIILNGKEFPVKKLRFNIFKSIQQSEEKFFLCPPKFPEQFELEVGSERYMKKLKFQRVANESIVISKYESLQDEALHFSYQINDRELTIKFQIAYDLQYAKSIQDIVETISIYDAFCNGEGTFCGSKIVEKYDVSNVKKLDSRWIEFWEKVLKVETALNQNFIPPKKEVELSTVSDIEYLYQNLIKKNPVRSNKRIDSVNGIWKENIEKKIEKSIGQAMCFEYQAEGRVHILGRDLELPCLCIVYNSKIVDYKINEEKKEYILYFGDEHEEKKMYVSVMWFANKSELNEFVQNHDTRMIEFENAKSINKFLENSQEL